MTGGLLIFQMISQRELHQHLAARSTQRLTVEQRGHNEVHWAVSVCAMLLYPPTVQNGLLQMFQIFTFLTTELLLRLKA